MNNEVEVRQPSDIERLTTDQLKFLANSSFVPAAYRGKMPEILACVATGRELGLGDMESLRLIYIVDGRPTLSAEAMVKLARRRGHSITADYGEGRVTVKGQRVDNADQMSVTWTMSMAKRAGLDGKANWTRYPEAMLWARAVSQLCRMLFPDVLGGVSHTPEEAELSPVERVETVTELEPVDVEAFEEIDDTDPPEFDGDQLFAEPSPEQHATARKRRAKGEAA